VWTLVSSADCKLGDIPVHYTIRDDGTAEAVLETEHGRYTVRSSFRGAYSVESPSGENIPQGDDDVFEAPGLLLREIESCRKCGKTEWGLYDSVGRMLFTTEFTLGSMCSTHVVYTPCGLNVKTAT